MFEICSIGSRYPIFFSKNWQHKGVKNLKIRGVLFMKNNPRDRIILTKNAGCLLFMLFRIELEKFWMALSYNHFLYLFYMLFCILGPVPISSNSYLYFMHCPVSCACLHALPLYTSAYCMEVVWLSKTIICLALNWAISELLYSSTLFTFADLTILESYWYFLYLSLLGLNFALFMV